jgi:hypothetical protein
MSVLQAVVLVTLVVVAASPAQEAEELQRLVDRLGQYLLAYESQLSTVVAEERYQQAELRPSGEGQPSLSGLRPGTRTLVVTRRRELLSEVAFLRLPGGAIWFGVREVHSVDGKPVTTNQAQLERLLKRLDSGARETAAKIVAESSQHNLGGVRTVNMPTTPLEVLHPQHRARFTFRLRGASRIEGTRARQLDFDEAAEPTLVASATGAPLFINGSAWIDPDEGSLWRVELTLRPRSRAAPLDPRVTRQLESYLRVDFTRHAALKMLVPKEMQERFWIPDGLGQGRAVYSNFRQFATSARIVPPP